MGAKFGERISFWQLINKRKIVIPTIQRDYTYGSQTPDTDKVLNKLLDDCYQALFNPESSPLTLDSIYGSGTVCGEFMPLDGQQRLTTLFLLHYYAAPKDMTGIERKILSNFSYATRESSKEFCARLLATNVSGEFTDGATPSSQLRNEAFFLPSFEDDPTIRSMLVVLDRIHLKFKNQRAALWGLLTADNCRINFDALDFGQFGLSDDLYIKMNARGKPLTEFEIFKSMFERHIESLFSERTDDKHVKDEISRKLDTDWADLIWNERNEDETKIDESFIFLFKNILSLVCWRNNGRQIKNKLDLNIIKSRNDLDFIIGVFDAFSKEYIRTGKSIEETWWTLYYFDKDNVLGVDDNTHRIRVFNNENLFLSALKMELGFNDILRFYVFLKWLLTNRKNDDAVRHLRNLIENSTYEIREERMPELIADADSLFDGSYKEMPEPKGFNVNQWHEELKKDALHQKWEKLYRFENSQLLRGAISCFFLDTFDLANDNSFVWSLRALEGMEYVFARKDDHFIRKTLLTYGDFSQSPASHHGKHMLGCKFEHWRDMLIKSNRRHFQDRIITLFHNIEIKNTPFAATPFNDVQNWRFYFVKYSEDTYFTRDGFYYLSSTDNDKSLEIISMNSTIHSENENNLEWRLLNVLLKRQIEKDEQLSRTVRLEIDPHGAKPLCIDGKVKISIRQSGWEIVDGYELVEQTLIDSKINLENHICKHPLNADVIEYGQKIIHLILSALTTK